MSKVGGQAQRDPARQEGDGAGQVQPAAAAYSNSARVFFSINRDTQMENGLYAYKHEQLTRTEREATAKMKKKGRKKDKNINNRECGHRKSDSE